MKLNKDELDKIVAFIRIVKDLPGHEQFIADLRKVLEIPTAAQSISHSDVQTKQKVDKIEKYLALDYTLDSKAPNIDYSFITDIDVRNQLESDYREMLRYRYGLRGHKTDFSEFCRYVQLQAEMVLNYYFNYRFDGIEEIKAHLLQHIKYFTKIDQVTYYTMLVGFCNEHNINYDLLNDVRDIRNSQSHRSILSVDIDTLITRASQFAEENKVWFDRIRKTINESKNIQISFKENVGIDIKIYNSVVREYMLNKNQPYNDIIESLSRIVNCISKVM